MRNHTKETLKIYWNHAKKYKLFVILMILTGIGVSICNVVVPLYFKKFFDVLNSTDSRDILVPALISILVSIAIIEFIQWAFNRANSWFLSNVESEVMTDLSNYCFRYLLKHSFSFFSNNFIGSLVKKVSRFVNAFEDITDRLIFDVLQLVVNLIGIIIVLMWRNYWLGLGLIGWIIVFLVVNYFFIRYKMRFDLERNQLDSKTSAIVADTMTNHLNVRLFNGYNNEVKSFGQVTSALNKIRKFTWNLGNLFWSIQGLFYVILEIGTFYMAIKLWQKNMLTLGDFVLINSYVLIVLMKVSSFGKIIQRIYESLSNADEMTEILLTPHEIVDVKNAKILEVSDGKIDFIDVSFNYNETRAILSKLNLSIASKEKVAFVGPSGAGKTTVVKLIMRLYDLTGGKILIDGQKISKVTLDSLWSNISMVPQEPILFHRSLMENIRYGRFEASDEEVIEAAKLAHCHEFISHLPNGYNTLVGERGVKLSGGERQRVAIARAILRDAPILLLDEATSSLDSESEHYIQDALKNLMKNKTVIVIAHRLSTIMNMDRIIVIDEGKVVEVGTHKELLQKKSGLYERLWRLQAGGFIQ